MSSSGFSVGLPTGRLQTKTLTPAPLPSAQAMKQEEDQLDIFDILMERITRDQFMTSHTPQPEDVQSKRAAESRSSTDVSVLPKKQKKMDAWDLAQALSSPCFHQASNPRLELAATRNSYKSACLAGNTTVMAAIEAQERAKGANGILNRTLKRWRHEMERPAQSKALAQNGSAASSAAVESAAETQAVSSTPAVEFTDAGHFWRYLLGYEELPQPPAVVSQPLEQPETPLLEWESLSVERPDSPASSIGSGFWNHTWGGAGADGVGAEVLDLLGESSDVGGVLETLPPAKLDFALTDENGSPFILPGLTYASSSSLSPFSEDDVSPRPILYESNVITGSGG